ncbi:hypothetical protein [uncultured Gammaproteobacteria bacterium]|jgi:hypothetical protein|nr:hypothetical protein [uncultured Gammaproteobacteria bacterium]SHN93224.1 hypothetical protein BCLUESOX_425 [bacterium endosymbiont of Bathymodiolus sp. 5 South]VVH57643.1 hypothetical protein BSPCLSOX_349 [uncultured Gammaproteobacteria bacterium]VVM27990.1 hypothetical protein BSPWISOXPB_765 [uncultured Gammaproteobacteria bacterium]
MFKGGFMVGCFGFLRVDYLCKGLYKLEKMKSYALGLLLLSSVNALGNECIINASDKSTYAIKSSIYSYSNDINTCKCQSGYEFSPFVSGGKLSKKDSKNNSFTEPSGFAGKQLQCVIPKDDIILSTTEWVISISVFAIATGAVGSYSIYKLKGLKNSVSEGNGDIELGQVNLGSDIQEGQISVEDSYGIVRDNRSESSHLEETIAGENQYEDPYPWSDNFNLEGTIAKENYSAGIDDGGGASWSGHSDLEKTIAKEDPYAEINDEGDASWTDSGTKKLVQHLPEASDHEDHIYAQASKQIEDVDKKIEDTTTESSELPKNTTADLDLNKGPPLPPREYGEITENLDPDLDMYEDVESSACK